jgi:glycosyltransferase involved in cell wall biosynthesis
MDEVATPRLHVLMVCGSDFESPTEKVVLGYALGLAAAGHEVAIAMRGDPRTAQDELDGETPERVTIFSYRFIGPRVGAAERRLVASFRPDVVHAFNPRHDVIAAVQGLSSSAAPLVIHFEDDEWGLAQGDGERSTWRRFARALACRSAFAYPPLWRLATPASLAWVRENAAALEAITPELAAHVTAELGRDCSVLLPVHPSFARLSAEIEEPPLPDGLQDRDLVVFTGAVYAAHAADFRRLVEAVGELKRRGTKLALVYAGAAAPRFDLGRWAHEAGLDDRDFVSLGYLSSAQLQGLLRRATVLAQPGAPTEFNRLRLPSKLQSYLASGTPTVTFACGAGELLEDRLEVLKTHGADSNELADRINELLADPQLRATLRDNGPRAAERLFDIERNTSTLLGIYGEAIRRKTRRR